MFSSYLRATQKEERRTADELMRLKQELDAALNCLAQQHQRERQTLYDLHAPALEAAAKKLTSAQLHVREAERRAGHQMKG